MFRTCFEEYFEGASNLKFRFFHLFFKVEVTLSWGVTVVESVVKGYDKILRPCVVNVEEHSTGNNNHVTNSGLLEACHILQQVINEIRQMGGNLPLDTNVHEVVNEEPIFGKPGPTIAEEWLARAEKILDTARTLNSQKLVYTTFMLDASAERWWKLLSMKWIREGVPSTWENFKREFTNKYVPAVTEEKRKVNFIKFEQRNMSVSVYESQFTDLARFCPHLNDTEERKVRKFVKGLNKDLRDKLIPLQLQTYMAFVDRALAIENDLEEQKNVNTELFRAPSYGGQGNCNSENVDRWKGSREYLAGKFSKGFTRKKS
ncbi:hypothetical protein RJ639_028424 [Escallonia herrerae]|uniref:Retrotransposon gag domain-containing protein n=1 Tax=Escallonia herrerae TaxID=1293975 RepID=A0AA88X7U7_9ASTE|nr:hypothetical protein RJ639_028424 [Escallonia herrerae]